jgi:hypothetical protein
MSYGNIYWEIGKDFDANLPIDEIRKRYPELIFEYVKNINTPKGYDIKKNVSKDIWICGKWREK